MPSTINASTTSGLIQTADSSGVLGLQAGNTTIATISGTGVAVTGNISATGTVAGSAGTVYPLVSGTSQASTSGTSIPFTGIPSWVKRITVMFNGVSTNGSSNIMIQLGTGSTSYTTTGYSGVQINTATTSQNTSGTVTTGFTMYAQVGASDVMYGNAILTNVTSNNWTIQGGTGAPALNRSTSFSGAINLSALLTAVRITTINGTDTFDAGSINILYE
jgi:hypothetical protein